MPTLSRTCPRRDARPRVPAHRWTARTLPAVLLSAALVVVTGGAGAAGSAAPPVEPAPAVAVEAVPAADASSAAIDTPGAAAASPVVESSVVGSLAAAYATPSPVVPMRTPPDAPSRYQGQVTCDPVEKPGAAAIRTLLRSAYGRANSGGITRACSVGGTSEHKEGRAYDWALDASDPTDRARASEFLTWLVGPDGAGAPAGNARRLGVQYVIWDRQTWQSWTGVWKPYTGANPHTDHIHLSLSWDGAFQRTSFWTGAAVSPVDHGPCQVYAGVLVAPYSGPNHTACPPPLPPPNSPTGWVEVARPEMRSVVLRGWAKDADTSASLEVHVYVDGRWGGAWKADVYRPDLMGPYGFELRVPLDAGAHQVCAYAINVGSGTTNTSLGCPTVAPLSGNPVGTLDGVSVVPGGVQVRGWSIDPDTDAPVTVHTYAGGAWAGAASASVLRPDVAAAYPLMGPAHGFGTLLTPAAGPQRVCTYAINTGPGAANPLLGCRDVVALGADPVGNVEQVRGGPGTVGVSGWVLDPDLSDSVSVHVYVDGGWRAAAVADRPRTDVAAAYPGWSAGRGFAVEVAGLAAGRHQVCTYAINVGPGSSNPLLRCQDVTVS